MVLATHSIRQFPLHFPSRTSPCAITFQLESTTYAKCVCSLRYPACNAHAPYIHLWPAWLYIIFPHYLINGKICGGRGKLLNPKCVFRFSLQLFSETFLIRRSERDMIKTYVGLQVKHPSFLLRF